MTTKRISQHERDQQLLDVLPAWSATLTAIAGSGAALLAGGIAPTIATAVTVLAGAAAVGVAQYQRALQRRVDAHNRAITPPDDKRYIEALQDDYAALLQEHMALKDEPHKEAT
jgi:uncharacterized membrane protein YebE (DUF533 family)